MKYKTFKPSRGPLFMTVGWAGDWHWFWVSDKGDKHTDIMATGLLQREGYPRVLRLTLGPLSIMTALAWKNK